MIKLGHIYARRREARLIDTARFGLAADDKLAGGVIEVIITNQPIIETTLATIVDDRYHGSDRIRGIRLIIDGLGKRSLVHNFLLESGSVAGVGMTQRRGESRLDNGRISGKLECKNEDVTTVRIFSVTFDAPVGPSDSDTGVTSDSSDQSIKEFESVVPGLWRIERWIGENGGLHSGTLSVDERLGEGKFRGIFQIVSASGGKIEEEVMITREGARVRFEGESSKARGGRRTA